MQKTIITADEVKADVGKILQEFCDSASIAATQQSPGYAQLWQMISRLVAVGGKRMRPYLVMLAYQMYGGKDYDNTLNVAAAQELLHLSMLIHDDIIDHDDMRYGIDNIGGSYKKIYKGKMSDELVPHFASSAALLGGDIVLSSAYTIILNSSLTAKEKVLATRLIGESIFAVVGGELMDTETILQTYAEADPIAVARYKTASYSFVVPLTTGASLAHAPEADLMHLAIYGNQVGMAFQLADDVLGVFGDEAVTGKSNTSDLTEARRTYLMQKTYELANESQRQILDKLLGDEAMTPKQADEIRGIIRASGALEATQATITSYAEQARAALRQLSCPAEFIAPLETLIIAATKRSK